MLADPGVRRRLLTSLEQKSASGAGDSLSWLDWFRRPAGLAFAGGLSAAALAVVLGVRIYQDSLKETAQSVATEEVRPATPQAFEPQVKAKENIAPAIDLPEKDAVTDKPTKRERSAEEVAAPERKQIQTPALNARALFYGGEPGRADARSIAKEQEQAMKPLAESAPQANRPERPLEELSRLGKAAGTVARLRPLGLRYSFAVRGTDGQEREVDAATAAKSIQPVFLTVEANQDAYLQVWKTVGPSTPQLLWPEKETGQASLKMTAGQRELIPLPMENKPITLTAHLSLVPPGPITKQEGAMYERRSPTQLQEFITPSGTTGSQEHATYIVNKNRSTTAQLAVEIILSQ